ncbi:hypothetical protein FH972_021959 [Carpinus fangiana]|uniref:Oxidoreductase-like domain-containing protein n=1 Tax=Carpinus fangiana TaxID=176857 RepID=A0A5N6KR74_9ROSI|nr:hypothetical protein FH972_021959 [Carpinus fangiana]
MQAPRYLERGVHLCQPCLSRRAAHTAAPSRIRNTRGTLHTLQQQRRANSSQTPDKSATDSIYDDLTKTTPPPTSTTAQTALPQTERDEAIARARVVFGSRLAGPADRRRELDAAATKIAGVLVPPRPDEPDNCCMSGCVNCVWDRYRDEMEEWAAASAEARQRGQAQREREAAERVRTRGADGRGGAAVTMPGNVASSVDDDGGGSETNWVGGEGGRVDLFEEIPEQCWRGGRGRSVKSKSSVTFQVAVQSITAAEQKCFTYGCDEEEEGDLLGCACHDCGWNVLCNLWKKNKGEATSLEAFRKECLRSENAV